MIERKEAVIIVRRKEEKLLKFYQLQLALIL